MIPIHQIECGWGCTEKQKSDYTDDGTTTDCDSEIPHVKFIQSFR